MRALKLYPRAPHKKLRIPDWYISSLMLDRALDAILRRMTLDRRHDVPYLAGYSRDGKTIYIDRHLPPVFRFRGREVAVDRYLILHEEVEKTLIDQLGLHYLHAHQIATRAEQAAVRADRITWRDYDRFMQKYVKKIGDERLTKTPADLDLKPYRDEHDFDLMTRMAAAAERGRLPSTLGQAALRKTLGQSLAALKAKRRRKGTSKPAPRSKAKSKTKRP